jgi:hypothetical protein
MSTIRTENIPTTIGQLNEDFAGRTTMANYDQTKLIHIHRRNRPYVWGTEMQTKLLDSILKGYYIPPIISCSQYENNNERRYVMEGGNRITTIRKIMNGEVRELTPAEYSKVTSFPITLVVMRNLTNRQQREMFRRLNKNIKVSDGQLYAMSEEDSPIVQEALRFLNDVAYPHRARITNVFFDTVDKDNDGRKNLENAMAIVSGAHNGIQYITKSFARQEENVESQTPIEPIDRELIYNKVNIILTIFERANEVIQPVDAKTKKAQFTVGTYIGVILYDILMYNGENMDEIITKWTNYIVMVRRNIPYAIEALEIKGAQNINPDKLAKKSYRVALFLAEGRIASEEETKQIKHVYANDQVSEEEEDDEEEIEIEIEIEN